MLLLPGNQKGVEQKPHMTTHARCNPQVAPLLLVVLSVTSPSCA